MARRWAAAPGRSGGGGGVGVVSVALPPAPAPLFLLLFPPGPPLASAAAASASADAIRRLVRLCSDPRRALVDATSGVPVDAGTPGAVEVVTADVELPTGTVRGLPGISTDRRASAYVLLRADKWDSLDLSATQAVVFGHGFSQKPRNTQSILRTLAAAGLAVIAPAVWLPDTAPPWVSIQTTRWWSSPPARLQTALAIDMLRAAGLARGLGLTRLSLLGHSMGGALALVVADLLLAADREGGGEDAGVGTGGGGDVALDAVVALAPAAGPLELTTINPLLSLQAGGTKVAAERVETFFRGWAPGGGGGGSNSPAAAPPALLLVSAPRDRIVPPASVAALLAAVRSSEVIPRAAHVTLASGAHTGFEDSLRVNLRLLPLVDSLLFALLDLLVYRWDVFEIFTGDFDAQLRDTKELLVSWLTGDVVGDRALYEEAPEGATIDSKYTPGR